MDHLAHPTDLELSHLLDGRLDPGAAARVRAHLEQCLACQVHVGQARPVDDARPTEAHLTDLVDAALRLPEQTVTALSTPRATQPAAGQLWRLEWRGQVALALLLDTDDRHDNVLVAPITTDPEWGDQYTLAVAPAMSPLGIELAVWTALRTHVPQVTLDQPLGDVDPSVVEAAGAVHAAFVRDDLVEAPLLPGGQSVGTPIIDPADERWEYREHVITAVSGLVEQADSDLADPEEHRDLGAVLYDHGVRAQELAEALGVSASTAFDLLRGTVTLAEGQIRRLEERFDISGGELREATARPDPDALIALSLPRIRDRFEAEARRRDQPPTALREACLEWTLALAARRTGDQRDSVQAWEQMIHEWLDASG